MTRSTDIDAPLLIAGHPIVAADDATLKAWLRRRRGFFARDRARWRDVQPAEIVDVTTGPDRLSLRNEHGQGWINVRGDADAAVPGTWTLVHVRGNALVDADQELLDARHDAPLDDDQHAVVEHVEHVGGHWSIAAFWTTPNGLRVRVHVDRDSERDPVDDQIWPGAALAPLELRGGRPHHVARS